MSSYLEIKKKKEELRQELRRAKARKYYHDNADEINRKRYGKNRKKKPRVKPKPKKVKKRRKYRLKPKTVNVRITYENGTSESFRILKKVSDIQLKKFLTMKDQERYQAERHAKKCPTCGRLPE